MNTRTVVSIVVVIAFAAAFFAARFYAPAKNVEQPIATVLYSCNAGKTITAIYYQGVSKPASGPDQPPIPGGSVALSFDDGSTMTLAQTISADGARYANANESFVFWNKGNGVMVLENDVEKSYVGCIAIAPESSELPQVYSNSAKGFSIRLPADYTIDESYKYQEFGPNKDISGVKFTIPASVAAGTNLSTDAYVSVEEIPNVNPQTDECSAKLFLENEMATSTVVEGDTTYSVASSIGAGAGNRYAETVYVLAGTSASRRTCIAVRYFVHYGVFENYPAGAVREFDNPALLAQFDSIRRSLVIVQ